MSDYDIRFYLSLLWRRLPYVIAIATVISAVGVAIAYQLPRIYRATSKILIEAPQIPEQLARSTVLVSGMEQIQITEQRMMTNANLLSLARKFDIYADEPKLLDSEIVKDMMSRTTFEQILYSPPGSGTAAFEVSFDAEDPDLAAEVAREMTNEIVQANARLRTGSAAETLQFFEQSVKSLGVELGRFEDEMLKFKTKNKDALPDSLEFRRAEQARQQERLAQLEREEATLRDRRSSIVMVFENTGIAGVSKAVTPEEQMLEQVRRTLAEQQGIYSDNSPTMKSLRSRIDEIESKVRAQRAVQLNASDAKKAPSELDIQLAEIDGRLSYIDHDKAVITKSLAELQESILATPANEVVLNALERNYKNTQIQYDTAVAKLAEASTGEQIEQRLQGVRFSVIEMATPPEKPARSKRRMIAAGSGFAGLAAGFGFVLLLELLNKTVRRPVELVQGLEIQPFATIPYIRNPGEVLRRKLVLVAGLLLVVAAIPGLLFAIHYYIFPLDFLSSMLTVT